MKACVLIPSYNAGPLLRATVAGVLEHWPDVIVVIDGSTDGSDRDLELLAQGRDGLRVHRLSENQGKGAAVLAGIRLAQAEGFTHALTMDSDGQHPADHISRFMETGATHPEALVLGEPVFDASAPALRVNGRKVSNWWANLETGWWGIHDSLFGMRLYLIAPLLAIFETTSFARRFDFDPEVAVRLCWRGVPVINLKTPVRYLTAEEGGVSQFRYLRDNTLLTGMHIRLFFGFLVRIPLLISRGKNPLAS
jgi:glycosyltransferase involved in cell wall biosynthesis